MDSSRVKSLNVYICTATLRSGFAAQTSVFEEQHPASISAEIKYKIRGLNNLYVEPEGQNNEINITGNWPDPSFQGDFLPAQREVTNSGFKAEWTVPAIATTSLQNPVLGASFLTPVDNYRMAIRAVKYAFLFLSLTFLSF